MQPPAIHLDVLHGKAEHLALAHPAPRSSGRPQRGTKTTAGPDGGRLVEPPRHDPGPAQGTGTFKGFFRLVWCDLTAKVAAERRF